jgi:hypothetical protein
LIVWSFDAFAILEPCAGTDERDELCCVDGAPAGLRGFDELTAIAMPAAREPGPFVTRWRSRTVAKVYALAP